MHDREEQLLTVGVLAIIVLCLGAFVALKLVRRPEQLKLFSATWQRAIHTEQFTKLNEDTSMRNMPSDAYNRDQYQRYIPDTCYRTEDEEEEYTDSKGRTQTREVSHTVSYDCSYWETWAKYNINRWIHYQDLVTNGNIKQDRVWAEFTPTGTGDVLGNIRESNRDETLYVTFTRADGKRTVTYTPSTVEKWQEMYTHSIWTITFNGWDEPIWEDLKSVNSDKR